jgi:isochorismate synthase
MENKNHNSSKKNAKKPAMVVYRFPHKDKIYFLKGEAEVVASFDEIDNGFVLQSFDNKKKYVVTKAKNNIDFEKLKTKKTTSTSQQHFYSLITKIKADIKSNKLSKVVAARVFAQSKPDHFHPLDLFKKALCYKEAFVSLVFIEDEACWIGATPELFLKSSPKNIETYSLAGTLRDRLDFSAKEIDEQDIVTRFITQALSSLPSLKTSTLQSKILANGSLNHLLTIIKAKKKKKLHWSLIAQKLHPTPAVGGFEKETAQQFILQNEKLDRRLFSGFLGEIKNGNAKLFVNLRCMEVTQSQLLYYAGCGITADSNAKNEWQETNQKMDIIRKLLKQ